MSVIGVIRIVSFIVAAVLAGIVLALASHLTWFSVTFTGGYANFAAMGIATGALTLFSLPPFLIVDKMRRGAMTSMIIVEMVTLTFLWIMWLTTASLSASALSGLGSYSCGFFEGEAATACNESKAIEAFSFLAFFTLLGYAFILLVFTLIAHNRGHSVWTSSVKETNFFAPSVVPPPTANEPEKYVGPPQGQYQYPPPNFVPPQTYSPAPQYGVPQQVGYPTFQAPTGPPPQAQVQAQAQSPSPYPQGYPQV